MKRIYFDIETGPRPEEELTAALPEFQPPAHYKDPEKIQKNLAEQRARWLDKAALDATSGRVLAIGYRTGGENILLASGQEAHDLARFWTVVERAAAAGDQLIGFNIAGFDLPFLVRRSWALRVRVPEGIFTGRYLNHRIFFDLVDEWRMGDRSEFISLKRLAEFLGAGTKADEGGRQFAEWFLTDRARAMAYLEQDLALTEAVAERLMGPAADHRANSDPVLAGATEDF